jgi:hypothetical protein
MDTEDTIILRAALGILQKLGSEGTTKKILIQQTESETGVLLTTERAEALALLLRDRRYAASHLAPITHVERWRITERGAEALAAL